ncbi:MAG: asparaginase [Hyphomicrobiales bacterium]|nr:MAG: asparaginase [Hyphomicrobiales bacterium]
MKQFDKAIIEVSRGNLVESIHSADMAICDAQGNLIAAFGEVEKAVFPRSAIKSFQALPRVEAGVDEQYGFADHHTALSCSSHNGEAIHVDGASEILAKAGLDVSDLECGVHFPELEADRAKLHIAGKKPSALHNNCSGKHSGMLAFAKSQGFDTQNYVSRDHPIQKEIAANLTDLMGVPHSESICGIDGCSLPTYAVPLANIAKAAAKFGSGEGMGKERASATQKIIHACCDHPMMVAGTDRGCTRIMAALGRKCFVKGGAEGLYMAIIPELGVGIAIKANDGARRASEVLIAQLIASVLSMNDEERAKIERIANPELKNWNKILVGGIQTSPETKKILDSLHP